MTLRPTAPAAAFVLTLILSARAALAHAHLDHASPPAGSSVTASPKEVVLWFTEALEQKFSTVEVRDIEDQPMQAGKAVIDPGNSAALRVPLKPLPPGIYKVIWRVLSVDTHRTQGDFTFTVGK